MDDAPTTADALPPGSGGGVRHPGRSARGLTHEIVEAIGTQLRSGAIKPGDKLPSESEIMQRYRVSRGVVREALSRLQAASLVQTHHGVGTFALERRDDERLRLRRAEGDGIDEMLQLLELRTSIESDAAALAATRRGETHLQALRAALDDFARHLAVVGETVSPDLRFHSTIAEATGNPFFGELVAQLGLAVIPRSRVSSAWLDLDQRTRHLQKVNQEHEDIFAAIARRDPEAARAAMHIHLVNSRERQRAAHTGGPAEKKTDG